MGRELEKGCREDPGFQEATGEKEEEEEKKLKFKSFGRVKRWLQC